MPKISKKQFILAGLVLLLIIAVGLVAFFLLQPKVNEQSSKKELSVAEKHWQKVFAKAFEPVNCPKPRNPKTLPAGYYKGSLIDTHIHMKSLPDSDPEGPLDENSDNIGTSVSVDKWVCMMNVEGTKAAFTFFPVWKPIIQESIDLVKQTMKRYPNRFIPFIMPPDDDGSPSGYPTVDAKELEEMLNVEPGLFVGYGEIGLYARDGGAAALPPDSERLLGIYPVVRKHNLVVYSHPGFKQKEALAKVAAVNRDITFIFHGGHLYKIPKDQVGISHDPKILVDIEEILENNPNVYYGVDELYGGDWLLEPGRSKKKFLDNFTAYKKLLQIDLGMWKRFIERHPDQVIWGTDRGVSASWDKDADVALTLNNYIRAFIGKLNPAVQEKFAYKNAESLFTR